MTLLKQKEYIRALTPRELILILIIASFLELFGIHHYLSISWFFAISLYINTVIGIYGCELGFAIWSSRHPNAAYAILFVGIVILLASIGAAAYGTYILLLQIISIVSVLI
jgi:hypothetical protein